MPRYLNLQHGREYSCRQDCQGRSSKLQNLEVSPREIDHEASRSKSMVGSSGKQDAIEDKQCWHHPELVRNRPAAEEQRATDSAE